MHRRRLLVISLAFAFATADLAHKAFVGADIHHARTPYVTVVMAALIVALVQLVPKLPSNIAAVGAGIACGGALGNLVSLLAWTEGVPDPFVVVGATRGVAFNLADVFAVCGDALLVSTVLVIGVQRRGALRQTV
ncbi:MAG: signal peptidase II [Gaiellaceae bacterium]